MVALKRAVGNAESTGEDVKFVDAGVTDQVTPQATTPWPHSVVDEKGHPVTLPGLRLRSWTSASL